jgi:hypothetical protein
MPMFMRVWKFGCGLGLALLLASCATMSPEECQLAQWAEVGQRDGLRGAPLSVLSARKEDCAKADVVVDEQAYQAGRELGLASYCRIDNAVPLGLSGASYAGVCPPALEAAFLPRYRAAHVVYSLRGEIQTLYDRTDQLERRLRDIPRREDDRMRSNPSEAERQKIRREADEERRNLRSELAETDRRLYRKREELRAAEFDLGNLR